MTVWQQLMIDRSVNIVTMNSNIFMLLGRIDYNILALTVMHCLNPVLIFSTVSQANITLYSDKIYNRHKITIMITI